MDRIQIRGGDSDRVVAGSKRFRMQRLNDATGQMEPVTSFESTEDLLEMMTMKDETGRDLYSTDAAFRETVKDMVANSPSLMAEPTLSRRSSIPNNEEMLAGLRTDALRQRRDRLVEAAAGGDLEAKYELAQAMMNPEYFESAQEMLAATEAPRPYENFLKSHKAQGLGPVQWKEPTEDADQSAQREASHNASILAEMGEADISLGDN